MTFRFSGGARPKASMLVEMALEARFDDGAVIQAAYASVRGTRTLVYRNGASGKWTSASGISFEGLPRTPENLARAVGKRDPSAEVYVMPAL